MFDVKYHMTSINDEVDYEPSMFNWLDKDKINKVTIVAQDKKNDTETLQTLSDTAMASATADLELSSQLSKDSCHSSTPPSSKRYGFK